MSNEQHRGSATPDPGEPHCVRVSAITQHLLDKLKHLVTQFTHLTWMIWVI
uniref:Uncharacterized protein n=1 Tax=Anguilla anguilla TaxID=7936 RepID=A0A0E9P8L1_ANGAN